MAELYRNPFDKYNNEVDMESLLTYAGFKLDKSGGVRTLYRTYTHQIKDASNKPIVPDQITSKHIVNGHHKSCFTHGSYKPLGIVNFIKEYPYLFPEYKEGLRWPKLVDAVCKKVMSGQIDRSIDFLENEIREAKEGFNIDDRKITRLRPDNPKSVESFDKYFSPRAIDLDVQNRFRDYFCIDTEAFNFSLNGDKWRESLILTSEEYNKMSDKMKNLFKPTEDGKYERTNKGELKISKADYLNLSRYNKENFSPKLCALLAFPLYDISSDGQKVIGLERRSRPDANGKSIIKNLATGSDAANGLWIARPQPNAIGKPYSEAKDVYWFESALDALAFYQIHRDFRNEHPNLDDALFVSTSGQTKDRSIGKLIDLTLGAKHHLCFDNDAAGRKFALNVFFKCHGGHAVLEVTDNKEMLQLKDMDSVDRGLKYAQIPKDIIEHGPLDLSWIKQEFFPGEFLPVDWKRPEPIRYPEVEYHLPQAPYKDWDDQLMRKLPAAKEDKLEMTDEEAEERIKGFWR